MIAQLVVLVAYGAAVAGGGAVLGFCCEGRGVAGDLHHITDQRAGDVPLLHQAIDLVQAEATAVVERRLQLPQAAVGVDRAADRVCLLVDAPLGLDEIPSLCVKELATK